LSGSLTSKHPAKTFSLSVGAGGSTGALQYSLRGHPKPGTTSSLRLRIIASNGAVLADVLGPSVLRTSVSLPNGIYTWEVSGKVSASFTLTVTYPMP
jgi:hypothetical protein